MKLHCRTWLLLWLALIATATVFSSSAFAQGARVPPPGPLPRPASSHPSIVMLSSYVVTAVVQGLDAHSTFKALDAGAIETNPLLTPLATNRKAFLGLKAAIAAALIYEAHGTSKQHKIRAVLMLAAIDSAYIVLAQHNYHVARVMNGR